MDKQHRNAESYPTKSAKHISKKLLRGYKALMAVLYYAKNLNAGRKILIDAESQYCIIRLWINLGIIYKTSSCCCCS
jgi:hypothetical protein